MDTPQDKPKPRYADLTHAQKLAYNRAKKKESRERLRAKRITERLNAKEREEQALRAVDRARRQLCWFGEIAPDRAAATAAEEIYAHRLFLRALREPDIVAGETLRDVAKRTYNALQRHKFSTRDGSNFYFPAYSQRSMDFDPDYGFQLPIDFDAAGWTSPKEDDGGPIDIRKLQPLPPRFEPELKQQTEPKPTPEQDDTELERQAIKNLSDRTAKQREKERARLLEMNGLPEAVRRYLQEGQ